MGIMVYSLLWAMQDFVHQPYLTPKVQFIAKGLLSTEPALHGPELTSRKPVLSSRVGCREIFLGNQQCYTTPRLSFFM